MSRRYVAFAAILLALIVVVVLARSHAANDRPKKNSAYLACVRRVAGANPAQNTIVWAKSVCAIDTRAYLA